MLDNPTYGTDFVLDAIAKSAPNEQEFRKHIGASVIGRECDRQLWYSFRWVQLPAVTSRIGRLFKRGHREEDVMLDTLEAAGFTLWRHAQNNPNEQIRAKGMPPHTGGSLDAVMALPYELAQLYGNHVPVECKTHAAKYFNQLVKHGVVAKHYTHWAQGNIYATSFGMTHFLYMAECKDDDRLYFEFCKAEPAIAAIHKEKARRISMSNVAHAVDKAPSFRCRMCEYQEICKEGKPASAINCRSCGYSTAEADGTFKCHVKQLTIDDDLMRTGCNNWRSII